MADRIVLMRQGVVEQIGTPLELYDEPTNTSVATFIGSPAMNLVSGELTQGEATTFRVADGQTLELPAGPQSALSSGVVRLGVRPEHFVVGDVGLLGTVAVVEPTGSETQLAVDVAGQRLLVLVKDRTSLTRGQPIRIQPNWSRSHLFDAESGARMKWSPPMLN